MALDKVPLGKLLKPLAGKTTVGQVLSRLAPAIQGGVSNAADQLLLNTSAKILQGYDRARTFDQGVFENVLMGSALGQHPSAPIGGHVDFDPEKVNSQFKPYMVAATASRLNESPAPHSSDAPARATFGERRESDDQPDRPYTAAEHAKADEVVRRELEDFKAVLKKLGVDYEPRDRNETGITDENEFVVYYSAGRLAKREKDAVRKGEKLGTSSRFSLREEIIHAAYLVAMRKEWEKSGSKKSFFDYVHAEHTKIFDSMRATIEAAKGDQRKLLTQALFDSFNLYKNNLNKDLSKMTVDEFFSNMETMDMKMEYVAEFLRQAAQLKRQGQLNEEIAALVEKKLRPWVMKVIARLRSMLPSAYEGAFGPEVKRRLEMLEKELDTLWTSS